MSVYCKENIPDLTQFGGNRAKLQPNFTGRKMQATQFFALLGFFSFLFNGEGIWAVWRGVG